MKTLTIQLMQELARKRGGSCLSSKYLNAHQKLKWRCKHRHIWETTPHKIRRGTWCPFCAGVKVAISRMRLLAKNRDGVCLSKSYLNQKTRLIWRCKYGHVWQAPSEYIVRGSWCPTCAQRDTIEDMKSMARKRHGACLSTTYEGAYRPLKWRCREGHTWLARPHNITNGTWCPFCAGRGKTIMDMILLARKRGGHCLAKRYVGLDTKLQWQCREGHKWWATPHSIIHRKSWCPYCVGLNKKTFQEIKAVITARGGRLITEHRSNYKHKITVECAEGHRWTNAVYNILKLSWCPQCSDRLGERICRTHFEQIFRKKFPSVRPIWLRNKAGNLMELDGYNEELKLAFEFQGIQHFQRLKIFHPSLNYYEKLRSHDRQKLRLCKKSGIKLIVVPHELLTGDLKGFILSECKKNDVRLPSQIPEKVDLTQAYYRKRIELMQSYAKKHDGRCLSTLYVNAKSPMRWQCRKGHTWLAVSDSVRRGSWCPTCARSPKNS